MTSVDMTYNCIAANRLLSFDKPLIMGILNITPDSFYHGSRVSKDDLLSKVDDMIAHDVDIIDVGGMSSRPGAEEISVAEELDRLLPAVTALRSHHPQAIISIDTYRAEVVIEAHQIGIDIVNDISAGTKDDQMYKTVAELGLIYVLMHMKGSPQTMQDETGYDDIIMDVLAYMTDRIGAAKSLGLNNLIVDPGIGFGKSLSDNYTMLKSLGSFQIFDLPVLVGLSRKSLIHRLLKISPSDALNGTSALHMLSLINGVQILRVHDVKEASEVRTLYQAYINS